jgi:hypothetical protein
MIDRRKITRFTIARGGAFTCCAFFVQWLRLRGKLRKTAVNNQI